MPNDARPSTSPLSAATPDVAVIGGGVIGLSIAWRARRRGLSVVLVDRAPIGRGTSRVAAGMLAPVSEADAAEPALLAANRTSAGAWPAFAAELEADAGLDPGLRRSGTLIVARDDDEVAWLEREHRLRERLGLDAARMLGSEARRLEPGLAPGIRAALDVPDDHAIDPRRLLEALELACARAGVELRAGQEVVGHDADGLTLVGGERLPAGRVVVATGAWTGPPVRPVKGQILRLRDPEGPGLVHRVLRFERGYLVPRGDGRYVLGATMEERGFDTTVTVGAVRELLHEAQLVVPGLDELVVEEASAGLRPGTPDNAPLIGDLDGVLMAAGHHRNGVLLAPFTAHAIVALLTGDPPPVGLEAFAPGRFAEVSAAP